MKNALFFFLILFISCNQNGKLKVSDTTKKESFEIVPRSNKNYSLKLKLKGNIEGESFLYLISEQASFKREIYLSGKIDTVFRFDWYQEKGKIIYEPITANGSELLVQYTFYD